ncbi:Flavohemoprotein (Hemoglobin-like protein) (Flavohemoglobin) (Nitric oxide dioxygenase) [hydrothermal vent metagenome]|uniref:Flavohemoprotein (Hemoglobin-like protein) (Flavohemoglobin) (Nitric oxide dioxygenase) n=1 Tax=hydrothermal vent metagenome TaxID=652676 RepID=A0A1W1CVW0_9ZZZZ
MNEATKAIIKATAPVLKQHGEAITKEMYTIMFTNHPEVEALFADSEPDQHKKLAAAVYAYAANIDQLDKLAKGIEKMVSAHVKTKVQPEHYPIVGASLLQAIKNVLGDAATTEIMDAWAEAYQFLAEVLIEKEKERYASLKA